MQVTVPVAMCFEGDTKSLSDAIAKWHGPAAMPTHVTTGGGPASPTYDQGRETFCPLENRISARPEPPARVHGAASPHTSSTLSTPERPAATCRSCSSHAADGTFSQPTAGWLDPRVQPVATRSETTIEPTAPRIVSRAGR